MFNSGNVTQAMLKAMLDRNPQMKMINELIGKHNGNAQAAFYDLAKQKGADPNQIINLLRQ